MILRSLVFLSGSYFLHSHSLFRRNLNLPFLRVIFLVVSVQFAVSLNLICTKSHAAFAPFPFRTPHCLSPDLNHILSLSIIFSSIRDPQASVRIQHIHRFSTNYRSFFRRSPKMNHRPVSQDQKSESSSTRSCIGSECYQETSDTSAPTAGQGRREQVWQEPDQHGQNGTSRRDPGSSKDGQRFALSHSPGAVQDHWLSIKRIKRSPSIRPSEDRIPICSPRHTAVSLPLQPRPSSPREGQIWRTYTESSSSPPCCLDS